MTRKRDSRGQSHPSKLRRQIAWEAARLMYQRQESEYYRAKMKAARQICKGWVKPKDLPSNSEIRDEIQNLARMLEGPDRLDRLRHMRLEALRMMRILKKQRPRLIGSVYTGHIRSGSDIDLHLFSDSLDPIVSELDYHGFRFETERKRVVKNGERLLFRHIHVYEQYEFELTVYPLDKLSYAFKSSITGKAIERASIAQLEMFLKEVYPQLDIENELDSTADSIDRFQLFYSLLLPLENVKQHPKYHPEGDALYHSLQVFDHACDALPYDEEFLLAALLHDVGKGLDPFDHVASGLEALGGYLSERTSWLIEHHMDAHKVFEKSLGARAMRRLRANESYDELLLLGECDRAGRNRGVEATELDDALDYIRGLASEYG